MNSRQTSETAKVEPTITPATTPTTTTTSTSTTPTTATLPKVVCETGIIGFFDILGFESFLEKNRPEEAAQSAFDVLLEISNFIPAQLKKTFGENVKMFSRIKWLVFSDTILMNASYHQDDSDEDKYFLWAFFICAAIELSRHMFTSGLPIRGGIGFGDYLIKQHCFAGRPIIDAYKLSRDLDFAGSALDDGAFAELQRLTQSTEAGQELGMQFLIEYLSPTKTRGAIPLFCLNLPYCGERESDFILVHPDLCQCVAESFWRYQKDVPPEALSKLDNTELYLRFLRARANGVL